jgi:hypothetical protein
LLHLPDKHLDAFTVRLDTAGSSIQPCRVSMDLTLGRRSFGHIKKAYDNDGKIRSPWVDSVHHLEDDAIYENYRVRDDDNSDLDFLPEIS